MVASRGHVNLRTGNQKFLIPTILIKMYNFLNCMCEISYFNITSSGYSLFKLKRTHTFIRSQITNNFQMERSPPGLAFLGILAHVLPYGSISQCTSCKLFRPDQRIAISLFSQTNLRDSELMDDHRHRCEKWWLSSKPDSYSWFTSCRPFSVSARGFLEEKFLFVLLHIV